MSESNNVSPLRPLLVGAVIGLVIGLLVGLAWAWLVDPITYAGGAFPQELSNNFQRAYVGSVAEAYVQNRDATRASARLQTFGVSDKVSLLAEIASDFVANGAITEAEAVGDLAQQLQSMEGWPAESISTGLSTAIARSPQGLAAFSSKLGMAPLPAGDGTNPQDASAAQSGSALGSILRTILIILFVLLLIAIVVLILLRIKPKRRTSTPKLSPELAAWDGSGNQPLRQWVGSYTIGQDTFDESFTVETPESDFLGECGMGILDGFASGSPKKVAAFDVWLFDKTDIRTVSMPIMSKYAYEDAVLRGKLPPDSTPILAAEGQTFNIETTALVVEARIDEVSYGPDKPDSSYFDQIKVSLTAFLKPDVDVSGAMPLPEGMA